MKCLLVVLIYFCSTFAQNYFEILQVGQGASEFEIRLQYEKLKKEFSKENNPGSEWHRDKLQQIETAYKILQKQDHK